MEEKSVPYERAVAEVRRACRQFALLYFHFSKVLVEEFGKERAKMLIQRAVFELSLDRSDQLRKRAAEEGLPYTMESFMKIIDLPFMGWVKELGRDHCPYAETWRKYFDDYPWFAEIAPFYCDIIDTTNAENFTRCLSHKITKNVLCGADTCEREYFPREEVRKGVFSYGEKPEEDEI